MTENDAIEKLHAYLECESRRAKIVSCNESCDDCELWYMQGTGSEHIASVETAMQALEEVQQYRQVGKIGTCRNAVEICKAMIERGIDPDNVTEYIKFEDNLMQRGYDLKRLLEMMEEHKQYRQICTVEECREAVEKQTAKKPVRLDKCTCPSCSTYNETWKKRRNTIPSDIVYCWHCGQSVEIVRRANDEKTD